MENLTVPLYPRLNVYFSIGTTVVLVSTSLIFTILQVGWGIFVVSNLRKAFAKRRRIKNENDIQDKIDCDTKITQGKFLLALIILEYLSNFSYWIGFLYPQLHHISPIFDRLSLPFNSTCIITIESQRIWIQELQYPVTAVFLSIGRSGTIFVMGVAASFFEFICNSFVTEQWRYKKIYRPIKYSLIVSVLIFLTGIVPQLIIFSRILDIIVFPILFTIIIKHAKFLSMAVRWRGQDLYHNRETYLLRLHNKQNKYFRITVRCTAIPLFICFISETLVTIEMIFSLILYYGKCFFPLLYDIQYTALITENHLQSLKMVIVAFSLIERSLLLIANIMFTLPFMMVTILMYLSYRKIRKQTSYRYSVIREPLMRHYRGIL